MTTKVVDQWPVLVGVLPNFGGDTPEDALQIKASFLAKLMAEVCGDENGAVVVTAVAMLNAMVIRAHPDVPETRRYIIDGERIFSDHLKELVQ